MRVPSFAAPSGAFVFPVAKVYGSPGWRAAIVGPRNGNWYPQPERQKVKAVGVCGIHTIERIAGAPLRCSRT